MPEANARDNRSIWISFAVASVVLVLMSAIWWSLNHPYATSWDEGIDINQTLVDVRCLWSGMIHRLGHGILRSLGRPPAYRLFALPLVALFGTHTATMRLVSSICFACSAWIIFLTTRRLSSSSAAAFAVLVFALSPGVVSASIWYSSEGPLYLAVSAMLFYTFRSWANKSNLPGDWIGLGLAIGLGFLSKASFIAIALPFLAFWFFADVWAQLDIPRFVSQWKAGLVAFCVAGPWWLLNIRAAVSVSHSAREFVRNSLGSPSLGTFMRWLDTVISSLLGYGVSILIALIALAYLRKAVNKQASALDPMQKLALAACACAGIPIVLVQLSGTNHLLRHISPIVIPLAIVVGILFDKVGWADNRPRTLISGALLCGQLVMIVFPAYLPNNHMVDPGLINAWLPWRIMSRRDQWDWGQLQNLASKCGLDQPKISYLGDGPGFSPLQISYPWLSGGKDLPDVKWLWRFEDGPLNWQELLNQVGDSDVVLTAPHYVGRISDREDLDNEHNFEFATHLAADPRFQGPFRLELGRFEPVEILVFVKNDHVCGTGEQTPAKN